MKNHKKQPWLWTGQQAPFLTWDIIENNYGLPDAMYIFAMLQKQGAVT